MKINSNPQKIEQVLTKGVEKILPSKAGLKKIMSKKSIKIYYGIDPTASRLHLGHTIGAQKLQEFADLRHEAILLVGTGTVLTGDPSGRDRTRPKITEKEIEQNIATWKKQLSKFLDFSKVKIKYNGDWLLKLDLRDVIDIASHISAVKLFKRDMFQRRLKQGDTVWMHETLYPLLQGYDSVAMDVDLEIGGTDQTFNMLIGRELQKKMNNREKFVLITPMILGIDGKQMSKTSGNCVWLSDSSKEMFGKIMSIPDELILSYFETLTNLPFNLIQRYKKKLRSGTVNPMELKEKLGFEIVKIHHSKQAAERATAEFERVFKEQKFPTKIPEIKVKEKELALPDLLVKTRLASSKSEAKRLILQGGVKVNGRLEKDWKKMVEIKKGMILQIGKRKFLKLR